MQTLTIKIDDNYAEKLFLLLDLFPKKALQIEAQDSKTTKELNKHMKLIQASIDDISAGKTVETDIVVQIKI